MSPVSASMTLREILSPYGIQTVSELARAVGMSRQQASELWTGRVGVGKRVGKRIADVTGCPIHVLMFYREEDGADSKKPTPQRAHRARKKAQGNG